MQTNLAPILRDYLIRFQQTAIKETGRRPLTYRREGLDEKLIIPGCQRPGYVFWQPISWPDDKVPLGENAKLFCQGIIDYLSMCQFMEVRFRLPVAPLNSPLSFLFNRTFETYRNTETATPERAFDEAVLYARENPTQPLAYCMAATCDGGEPLLVMLRAEDGQMYVRPAQGQGNAVYCKLTIDRLLPKMQFVYDY